jgi:excisionase family DNA binding protein
MPDSAKNEQAEGWLTLQEASDKMGVSPATLRAWADQGRIPSYRTPGGHRRFRVPEGGTPFRSQVRGMEARWRLLEHSVLGRVNLEREGSSPHAVPAAGVKEQRELERKLIRLCILALQRDRAGLEESANEMGQALGKWNWRYGVPLAEAFAALSHLRRALNDSVVEFVFGVGDPNVDELNLWLGRVNGIIDLVIVSMLEYRGEDSRKNAGK